MDLLISLVILAGLMAWYHVMPTWRLWRCRCSRSGVWRVLGIGLWLAALNVKYRDFRYIIPFIVQFGLFVSPVGYPSGWFFSRLMEMKYGEILYGIFVMNPMVGVIDGFRWAIGGQAPLSWSIVASLGVIALVGLSGLRYFRSDGKDLCRHHLSPMCIQFAVNAPSPQPSPPLGERVSLGRVRGNSWPFDNNSI